MDGKLTKGQARELMGRYLDNQGAAELARLGFLPQSEAGNAITELASVRRLQLIIDTNVRMAHETGAYEQWAENADYMPYGVWRIGVSAEHREAHEARDGKMFRFDHPIWTQDPPGGRFNCHCYREELTEKEAQELGLTPEPANFPFKPTPLGFDPSKGIDQPIPEKEGWPDGIVDAFRSQAPVIFNYAPADIAEAVGVGIAEAKKAFGANIGADLSGVRVMTVEEEKTEPAALGIYNSLTKEAAVRSTCPILAFTTVHEIAHHVLKKRKDVVNDINAVLLKHDSKDGVGKGAYAALRSVLIAGEKRKYSKDAVSEEIAVRAAAWTIAKYSSSKKLRGDFLDISRKPEYIDSRFSRFNGMSDVENVLMNSIVKTSFFSKLKRKLGLSDTESWRDASRWGFEIKPEWTYADALLEWDKRCRAGEIKRYTM